MKRIIVILSSLLLLSGLVSAQPRAIGVRTGFGHELSFQYSFQEYQFLQVDLGTVAFFPEGARLTGTYNFIFSEPQWTSRGDWAWYAGAGAALGVIHHNRTVEVKTTTVVDGEQVTVVTTKKTGYNYLLAGVVPMFGLEYTFWFPLQVSVDIRPTIGAQVGRKDAPANGFYMDGITFGFIPSLSVRYRF